MTPCLLVGELMYVVRESVNVGIIEAIVMVATYKDFVFVWQVTKPVEEIHGFLFGPYHAEVSGMYHHIGIRQIPELMMAVVSVGKM